MRTWAGDDRARDPELAALVGGVVLDDGRGTGDLSQADRMVVAVVALVAAGQRRYLPAYLRGAVEDGVPVARLRAVLRSLVPFCGFPAPADALRELDRIASTIRS